MMVQNPVQQLIDEAVRQAVADILSTQDVGPQSTAPATLLTRKKVDALTGAVSTQHALMDGDSYDDPNVFYFDAPPPEVTP